MADWDVISPPSFAPLASFDSDSESSHLSDWAGSLDGDGIQPTLTRHGRWSRRSQRSLDSIAHDLLNVAFDERQYVILEQAAIQERESLNVGKSQAMISLYHFWCYYLRDHFDQLMYDEFLELARKDAMLGQHYGIECFFRFCSYGLERNWQAIVFDDFQREAVADFDRGSTYGIEKVKAFLVHNQLGIEIPLGREISKVLERYPTLDSFKRPAGKRGKGKRERTPRDNRPWVFGRPQPSSAPIQDSPIRRGWQPRFG
jgi:la-related protein 1